MSNIVSSHSIVISTYLNFILHFRMIEWFFCDENYCLNLFSVITIGSPAYGVVYETEPSFIERSVQRK